MTNRNQPRKEHLLNIAYTLFSTNGFHRTGIDTIVQHSGVSKTTMYKYFRSKEELVLEVLKRRHYEIMNRMDNYLNASKRRHPEYALHQHIEVILDETDQWIRSETFTGCDFINACAEFADHKDPIHQVAAKHKRAILQKIEDLLADYPSTKAEQIARQIVLALDGAIVRAQVLGDKSGIALVRSIAASLLQVRN